MSYVVNGLVAVLTMLVFYTGMKRLLFGQIGFLKAPKAHGRLKVAGLVLLIAALGQACAAATSPTDESAIDTAAAASPTPGESWEVAAKPDDSGY